VIYFPKLPACGIDYTQILKKYEDLFNRLSTKSKTRDLLKYKEDIIIELNHEYSIHDQENEKEEDLDDKNLVLANIAVAKKLGKGFIGFITKRSVDIQSFSFYLVIQLYHQLISPFLIIEFLSFIGFQAMLQNIVILLSFKNYHSFTKFGYGLS